MADGSVELMIQRRLLHDDSKGVGEPLNETVPVRTNLLLQVNQLDDVGSASAQQRVSTLSLNNPFQLFFGSAGKDASWLKQYQSRYAPIVDLPVGVQLISLRTLADGQVLVRLSHIFAAGEGSQNSQAVTVDLSKLFVSGKITAIVETQLSANQPLSQMMENGKKRQKQ